MKCPWRVEVDPNEIPNGYCATKHAALSETIADPGGLRAGPLRMMACHETPVGKEVPCVGWLHHQLGEGNNLAVRLAAITGRLDTNYALRGEQHTSLEDTLPEGFAIEGDR